MLMYLIFASVTLVVAASEKQCCEGDNILANYKFCRVNRTRIQLTCNDSYFVMDPRDEESEIKIDMDDNLLLDGVPLNTNYCVGNRGNASNLHKIYLVCFADADIEDDKPPVFLTILIFLSVVFLAVTVAIYLALPQLLNLQGICMVHSIAGLTLAFLMLSINQVNLNAPRSECIGIAATKYFSFIYTFFWLNILSFHIWRTTAKPQFLSRIKSWKYIYHIYGFAGPLIFLTFLLVGQYGNLSSMQKIHPGFGNGICWFSNVRVQFVYFYYPVIAMLCINIAFFICTVKTLWNDLKNANEKRTKVLKYRFKLCLKLFIIMGLSWVFEVISAVYTDDSIKTIWLITDTVNASEGLLIFLTLVVFRKKVIRELANKNLCGKYTPNEWRSLKDEGDEDLEISNTDLSDVHTSEEVKTEPVVEKY